MSNTTHPDAGQRLALTAAEAANLLGISERHWWSLHASGRCPRPVSLGRARRWPLAELEAWLSAGCPERDRWETIHGGRDA